MENTARYAEEGPHLHPEDRGIAVQTPQEVWVAIEGAENPLKRQNIVEYDIK